MSHKPLIVSPSLNNEFDEFISQGKDLTDVLEWIQNKLNPEDVFSFESLIAWSDINTD